MNKIKGFRSSVGYSQKLMSEKLGISEATYRNKENGKNVFNKDEIKEMFLLFNQLGCEISLDDLFF